jgi:hypothetical protein
MEQKITLEEANLKMQEIAKIKKILLDKEVIRSEKLLSDYVEWFVSKLLNLTLAENNVQKDWDAKDEFGQLYQIKLRTGKPENSSGFNHTIGDFHFLIVVFVNPHNYEILEIYKIPMSVVKKFLGKKSDFRWKKESKNHEEVEKIYTSN